MLGRTKLILAPRWLLCLLLFGVLIAACASPAQQAAQPTATPTQASTTGQKVTIPGVDGKSVTVDTSLPPELQNFPVPQGFRSEGGGTMTVGGDKLAAYSWKGPGQPQAAMDFYKNTLPGQGWKEESTFTTGDGGMLNYSKPDGFGLTVTVSKDSGSNDVTIAVLAGKSSATPTPKPQSSAPTAAAKSGPQPTATPEPTWTPAPPKTGDASAIPAELKDVPIPSGFAPVKDSALRMAVGGKFVMASIELFGKMSVKDASAFYASTLPTKGWTIDADMSGEDESTFICSGVSDKTLHLTVNVREGDAGTTIVLAVNKQ